MMQTHSLICCRADTHIMPVGDARESECFNCADVAEYEVAACGKQGLCLLLCIKCNVSRKIIKCGGQSRTQVGGFFTGSRCKVKACQFLLVCTSSTTLKTGTPCSFPAKILEFFGSHYAGIADIEHYCIVGK